MFTGLVQALATLRPMGANQVEITCTSGAIDKILQDLEQGDSVAVDGVCLTVVEILHRGFVADASPETLARSTLGRNEAGYVNLETSLRVGSKLGGHFVTGHVDGVGCLQESVQTATSWELTFSVEDDQVARYVVPKGSIAVNGVSLTVAGCDPTGGWFTVAVIPHTFAQTNLQFLKPGHWVNLEGDILGKYVERFTGAQRGTSDPGRLTPGMLSPLFLAEHGYL